MRRDGTATTEENGAFRIEGIAEGEYELNVIAQDGSKGSVEGVAAGSDAVEIVVPRVGSIVGTVVGGSGQCSVTASPSSETGFFGLKRTGQTYSVAGTRDFSLSAVLPGDYRVEAVCDEGVAATTASVSPGGTTKIEIQVGEAGTIRGVVKLFPDGKPASGVRCQAGAASDTTDATGAFELKNVLPGEVQVSCGDIMSTKFSPGLTEVSVPAGGVANAEVFIVEASMMAMTEQQKPGELLGAELEPVDLDKPSAFKFTKIVPGGPADQAGIKDEDILATVAGGAATGSNAMAAAFYVMSRQPGATIQLAVRRGADELSLTVELGEVP